MKNLLSLNIGSPLKGIGPLGLEGGEDAPAVFNTFISSAIGLMTIIAGVWFVFLFITGAISMMTAGDDKQALEGARKKITNGIIGLIVVVTAIFIINLIGALIGFNLILNPATLIISFWSI